ncbi:MAG: PAS domain-containing sensor histidine kinase [Candidatus Omnitrophica bacterium CG11_big_fil_rev_8_21_14_0_20_45_26]|uniref:histidine kinase n=1 Tax=Candidatus Abzuiibacterium crystallinum TaxID=1974748 RepID=A0A2H0LMZ8_9BACT|nr:MAG: PAS domain-containing sensor histidine kinase [Candidatus Omnitrophica bacterium CG11_big_fil_rev_8_21_14_0_20_45_26]PIW65480.1 MAG: PAS domain-containing sensor histidine kinase [Candidatus Omnitrophica bacterium CG12_big_fil_rev_8_21_14_0_65_45_16]
MKFLRQRFGAQITFLYLTLFFSTFLLVELYLSHTVKQQTLEHLETSLKTQAHLVDDLVLPAVKAHTQKSEIHTLLKNLSAGIDPRITVINADGEVLGDSQRTAEEFIAMDNHRSREEVKGALKGNFTTSMRFSHTLKQEMLYAAQPLRNEKGDVLGVVRFALPLTQVNEVVAAIRRPILAGFIAGAIVVLVLGFLFNRSITNQISSMTKIAMRFSKGDFSQKIYMGRGDELQILADVMNQMAKTLKKRIEETEAEKIKLLTVLENMAEGVLAVDQAGRILMVNSRTENIFGIKKSEALGRALLEIVKHEKIDQLARQAMSAQTTINEEITLIHGDRKKILRINAVGMGKSESNVAGILVFRDVTQLRELENMRREFVANVSHELKTPMTSIKGFVETLLDGAAKDPAQTEKFLKMIEEDTNRLSRLINDILALSKIESKSEQIAFECIDLNSEIERSLTLFANQINEKKLQVQNHLESKALPPVKANRDQLRQVIINLIENAIKFNQLNGMLELDAVVLGEEMRVSIKDTGIGIPANSVQRVFERFYRVDPARSRELGGTGLGLSIVKHIIEEHGGRVVCESALSRGTTFYFTLPLWRT